MNIFEQAWEFLNNKKVAIGSLLMAIAIVIENHFPGYIVWAGVFEEVGLMMGGVGFAHKAVKLVRSVKGTKNE